MDDMQVVFKHKFYNKYVHNELIEDKRNACVTSIKNALDYIESHGLTVKSTIHYKECPNQTYDRFCPCLDLEIRIFQIINTMDELYTDYKGLKKRSKKWKSLVFGGEEKFNSYNIKRRPKKNDGANGKTREERRATIHFEKYIFENVTDL